MNFSNHSLKPCEINILQKGSKFALRSENDIVSKYLDLLHFSRTLCLKHFFHQPSDNSSTVSSQVEDLSYVKPVSTFQPPLIDESYKLLLQSCRTNMIESP